VLMTSLRDTAQTGAAANAREMPRHNAERKLLFFIEGA